MTIVKNQFDHDIDFDVAAQLMDDEIREDLHLNFAPCTEQEFFDEYCKAHLAKYSEEFILNERNPQY